MSQLTERPSGESAIEARSGDDSRPEGRPSWSAKASVVPKPNESALADGAIRNQSAIRNPKSAIGKPLLKWAGGKRQLLPALRRFYPATFRAYFEPFAGSAAVFFDLTAAGRLANRRAALTDSNVDLIGCYRMVRDRAAEVLHELEQLAAGHAAGGRIHFYAVRDRFNAARLAIGAGGVDGYTPELAATLLYLNRTGFNGLFRLNARGHFNVPMGRYARPRIADAALIGAVSAALAAPGVTLTSAPFDAVLQSARAHDFIYFDPPYAPLSATARFTAYTAPPFTLDDHARLRDCVVALARRGCHVLVSNSSAPEIVALYTAPEVVASGLRIHRVPARRAINSRPSARGPVIELLLTNIRARPAS